MVDAGQRQGQEWRALSAAKKSKFDRLAAKDRERFTVELEKYREANGCEPPAKKSKKESKPAKDPDKPKGAMSSYMYFCKDYRSKNKNSTLSVIEAGEMLGSEWRSLSATKRAKYDKQAAKDRERYSAQMAKYKETHPEPVKEAEKQAGPKKPTSSYMYFNQEVRPLAAPLGLIPFVRLISRLNCLPEPDPGACR